MNETEIAALRRNTALAYAAPDVVPELDALEKAVLMRAFAQISKGQLTPEQAMGYLMKLHGYHELRNRFAQAVSQSAPVERR